MPIFDPYNLHKRKIVMLHLSRRVKTYHKDFFSRVENFRVTIVHYGFGSSKESSVVPNNPSLNSNVSLIILTPVYHFYIP